MQFKYILNYDLLLKICVQFYIGFLFNVDVVFVNRLSYVLYCWVFLYFWEGYCINKFKLIDVFINNGIIYNMIVNFNFLKSSVWFFYW